MYGNTRPTDARERERVRAFDRAAGALQQIAQRGLVEELDVRRVGTEAGLLRRDQHDAPAGAQSRQPFRDERGRVGARHVLEHVREEQCVEALARFLRRAEGVGREGECAARARGLDGGGVRIDADGRGAEVQQIAPDAAADFERAAELEAPQVPAIRRLHVEPALPARAFEAREPRGVGVALRVGVGHAAHGRRSASAAP